MHLRRAALLAALLSLTGAASASATHTAIFHTPSGNIGCVMWDKDDIGIFVRCDIGKHNWALPPKPHSEACRDLDYVPGLTLDATSKSHFFCAGDTVLHQGSELAYGKSRRVGRFTCTSRATGVTCRNRRNGHGLFLSRSSYRRF
jgi:hypothetical protein